MTLAFDLCLYCLLLITIHSFTMHQLSVDSVQLSFGERRILSNVNLRLHTGTITGLLGLNGAGKSCLMQILYGTLPAAASISIDDRPVRSPYRDPRIIRFLPQFNFIPKSLSLGRVLDDFQLPFNDLEKRFPEFNRSHRKTLRRFSGGQRRFIELYIIIRSAARFALLDEPFTHLMPLQIDKIKELLLEEKRNKAFLVTDHLYHDVIAVSDQLYVLADGTTHLLGHPGEVQNFGYLPPRRN